MKDFWKKTVMGTAALSLLLGAPARAEEEEEQGEVEKRLDALESKLGFEFGGMIYGSYQYNFNDPESDSNTLRSLDPEDNNFTFDLFQLSIGKQGPDGLSFFTKLDFGKTASRIPSDWNGDGAFDNSEETNDFEVQNAYINYAPEWAGGASATFGKFVTLLGSEVIEAPLNPNFTRSFSFGFSIPFTHTGLLFNVPVNELAAVNLGVVNGWDNVVDSNDGKTFLGNIALTPMEGLAIYLNGVAGPEKPDTDDGIRGVFDLVVAYSADPLLVNLNFDYGSEGSAAADGGSATWVTFSGIVGVTLTEVAGIPAGLFLRGEIFDDQDGVRTGTEQELYGVTVTAKYFASDHLTFWLEVRTDGSDKDPFIDEGIAGFDDGGTPIDLTDDTPILNVNDTQTTALAAISYVF